ncbi:MAG: hypothetical protein WCT77_04140, partial [Bacteroidota bacterium]
MKTLYLILIFFLVTNSVYSTELDSNYRIWSQGTAYTLPEGRWEVGIFQPLRYGLKDKIELSTQPLTFLIMPNLDMKWGHGDFAGFSFASSHGIYYPSMLLRTIAMKGTGGIISPEFEIPDLFSFYNDLLFSKMLTENLM